MDKKYRDKVKDIEDIRTEVARAHEEHSRYSSK
jgi:tellurite resistance protein TerC